MSYHKEEKKLLMSPAELLEKFLEFENNSNVLNYHYRYRNMLIWPFVRVIVLDAILKSYNGKEAGYSDNSEQNMGKNKILSYRWMQFFKVWRNPLFCKKKRDVLFLTFAVGNVKDDKGYYYDRVHDDLVVLHDSTAIIESAPLFRHFYPRKYKALESDFLDILCLFHEKLSRLHKTDKKTIDAFITYLKNNLPFEVEETCWRTVRLELERYAKNNKLIYPYYKRCFTNMKPKIVFATMGCYGNQAACKIKVLHDLGIPCAEIQHGLVGLNHFAYNFSNNIFTCKEYLDYMPDVFLTMGKYWMDCIRIPVQKEVLGNANFCRNRKLMGKKRSQKILILPTDTQTWLDLVEFIGEHMPDKEIIIKVHPLLQKQYEIFNEIQVTNIKSYIDGNIYEYLEEANVVIGDGTTVLYEAAALKKTVMVWNNSRSVAYIDSKLGYWFDDKYELLRLLQESPPASNKEMIASEDIFAYDMETNYLDFIKKYL